MTRLAGLFREPECSPGRHLSNDALLLEQLARQLRARGADVVLTAFDRHGVDRPDVDAVFSMWQGRPALDCLLEWERTGLRVVNSPQAALNTYRDRLPGLLAAAGVPYPQTRLVPTSGDAQGVEVTGTCWLKRGDMHASVSADVQRIETREALRAGLAEFAGRGIGHAVVQEHRTGSEIKFYGVAGGAFFHWFFTSRDGAPEPGTDDLQRLAGRAAAAAGLEIFGGDIIVEPSGALTLIDLNDWPSFAPCRDAASEAIADYLMRRVDAAWNPGLVASADRRAL